MTSVNEESGAADVEESGLAQKIKESIVPAYNNLIQWLNSNMDIVGEHFQSADDDERSNRCRVIGRMMPPSLIAWIITQLEKRSKKGSDIFPNMPFENQLAVLDMLDDRDEQQRDISKVLRLACCVSARWEHFRHQDATGAADFKATVFFQNDCPDLRDWGIARLSGTTTMESNVSIPDICEPAAEGTESFMEETQLTSELEKQLRPAFIELEKWVKANTKVVRQELKTDGHESRSTYLANLPSTLKRSILSVLGEEGRAFFSGLPFYEQLGILACTKIQDEQDCDLSKDMLDGPPVDHKWELLQHSDSLGPVEDVLNHWNPELRLYFLKKRQCQHRSRYRDKH